jgi:hypothetical protein
MPRTVPELLVQRLQEGVATLKEKGEWPAGNKWRKELCKIVAERTSFQVDSVNAIISWLTPEQWESLEFPEPTNTHDRPGSAKKKSDLARPVKGADSHRAAPRFSKRAALIRRFGVQAKTVVRASVNTHETREGIPGYMQDFKPVPRVPEVTHVRITNETESRGGLTWSPSRIPDEAERIFGGVRRNPKSSG